MIHINGRFLYTDHPTGTHRSAENFVRALVTTRDPNEVILWCNPSWPRVVKFFRDTPLRIGNVFANNTATLHFWEQFLFPILARDGIGLNLIGTGPTVFETKRQMMLVHDLNSLIIPEAFSWKYRQWSHFAKYCAIRRAGRIFCLTSYVRDSLITRLGMDVSRVSVIPQGPGVVGIEKVPGMRSRNGRRHFICVGSLQPHKNLYRVLSAWQNSGLAGEGFELRIIGRAQRNFTQSIGFDVNAMHGVSFTGYVTDTELVEHYCGALGVIFPSLHEGFGLPIVEGFFSGAPVITSRASCMPEVAGDAAILVDPESVDEISAAMCTLAHDERRWLDLVARGWQRRALFTWENAGRGLSELLDEFMQELEVNRG